jgi:hypothetical protein
LERTVADVLREALSAADEELFLVNPERDTIEELVEVMEDAGPTVRLVADEPTLKSITDDFLVASRTADHMEAGRLELRSYDGRDNTLLVTDSSVVALVRAGDRVAGLTTTDESFTESAYERVVSVWESAAPFDLRTPALSRVRETLAAELGSQTAADFDDVLSSLETARGTGGLDEVSISLLVAAKNEDLLYDISKWGEDVGIASKATFSRTKTRLEEQGLIDTEKVPIDVGRPRLRLKLGNEQLKDADTGQLAGLAQSLLTAS